MDNHCLSGQGVTPACPVQLENAIVNSYGVVIGHRSFVLNTEDPVQVLSLCPDERAPFLCGRNSKALVEFPDVLLAQEAVGRIAILDAADSEFLRQPSLPCPKLRSLLPRASGE